VTDLTTAELVKTSANAFLATKVSFINAIAEVCEASGADIVPLAQALALDERIGGRFLVPGLGFGGGCLPKDIRAFAAATRDLGVGSVSALLGEVDAINLRRRARMVDLALEMAGGSLEGRAVGVLGCSFKPNSDDIRDSPALDVAGTVHGLGARVTVYDPAALDRARQVHPELEYADSMLAAAADADVLLLLTEWREFIEADPEVVGKVVARRNIADGRGALDGDRWRRAGWRYRALGRPDTHSSADSISLSG
jgi:UDPglucose 6-dehydrogenase